MTAPSTARRLRRRRGGSVDERATAPDGEEFVDSGGGGRGDDGVRRGVIDERAAGNLTKMLMLSGNQNGDVTQQTLTEGETVIGEIDSSDGLTQLIDTDDGVAVREAIVEPGERRKWFRSDYDSFETALLHFGLIWELGGDLPRPEGGAHRFIPVDVATEGKPAMCAWLRTGGGLGRETPAARVSDRMGVSERTVTNYLSRFRSDVREEISDVPSE